MQWSLYDLSIYVQILKIADWPIRLDTCQISGTRKPDESRRNVYLLKIRANSFRDGSQDICKNTESNLGPFAGF